MTAPAPIPATEVARHMPNPPDTAPKAPSTPAAHITAAASTLRSQAVENPLMTLFCLMIIALLSAAIASPHIRINDTNARIDRLDARMAAGFDKVDARFDDLEADIDTRFDKVDARFDKVDARFDDLVADIDTRFDKAEADIDTRFDEVDARFDKVDARFDEVDAGFDELNLKLTALIAELRATDDVNATIEGRLDEPAEAAPAKAAAGR